MLNKAIEIAVRAHAWQKDRVNLMMILLAECLKTKQPAELNLLIWLIIWTLLGFRIQQKKIWNDLKNTKKQFLVFRKDWFVKLFRSRFYNGLRWTKQQYNNQFICRQETRERFICLTTHPNNGSIILDVFLMTCAARRKSETGIYLIMIRGINKQNIFEDDEDCEKISQVFQQYKEKSGYQIYVYCQWEIIFTFYLRWE